MEKESKAHSETGGPFLLGKVIRLTRGYAKSSLGNIKGMLEPETDRHQVRDK